MGMLPKQNIKENKIKKQTEAFRKKGYTDTALQTTLLPPSIYEPILLANIKCNWKTLKICNGHFPTWDLEEQIELSVLGWFLMNSAACL